MMQTVSWDFLAAGAVAPNHWIFPGSIMDPRAQRVKLSGGATGDLDFVLHGIAVTVAVGDNAATVQTALNDTTTGWGQIGVVVAVTGVAANWVVSFTTYPPALLPPWIALDVTGLTGTAEVSSDTLWLASGVIETISFDGDGTTPDVEIYNAQDINGRPIYSVAAADATRAQYKGLIIPFDPAPGTLQAAKAWECAVYNATPTPSLITQPHEWTDELSGVGERTDLGIHCPYGMVVRMTDSANQTGVVRLNVSYDLRSGGRLRLKADAANKIGDQRSPISV